ncbi:isoprenylcysteine carboxylmethyltransferase family protein, partial [bacterium]
RPPQWRGDIRFALLPDAVAIDRRGFSRRAFHGALPTDWACLAMEARTRLNSLRHRFLKLHGRQARPAPVRFNLIKTFLQTLGMCFVFLLTGPYLAFEIESLLQLDRLRFTFPGQLAFSILLFMLGGTIAGMSAYFMVMNGDGTPLPTDSTRKLVVVGPYRYVRNPMAFASLVQGAAVGMGAGSPLILLYILVGVLMWNYLARPWEEADLLRKFGAEYEEYRRQVRCWAPRLRPYSPDSHVTASRSTITAARTGP